MLPVIPKRMTRPEDASELFNNPLSQQQCRIVGSSFDSNIRTYSLDQLKPIFVSFNAYESAKALCKNAENPLTKIIHTNAQAALRDAAHEYQATLATHKIKRICKIEV